MDVFFEPLDSLLIQVRKMQVEELAFLVKDNLPCKHLVLSMEEALINFLQEDPRCLSFDCIGDLNLVLLKNRLLG